MKQFKLAISTAFLAIVLFTGVNVVQSSPVAALPYSQITATALSADACEGLKQLDSSKSNNCGSSAGVNSLVKAVVNILSIVVGIVAVIMVIISGLKYVTSSGDPSNISSAKNTLLYALVGLFIASLAQFLVHFVLSHTA